MNDLEMAIDQSIYPGTITFNCEKLEFTGKGGLLLSLEAHDFMVRFDEIIFESGGKKVVYRKEKEG